MKIILNNFTYNTYISKGRYKNNRRALRLIDNQNGELIAVATVNLPNESLEPNEVFIKDYSENKGMLDSLIKNKIISNPIEKIPTGFIKIYKCKILI